jgi:hypothetical protein
VSSAGVDNTGRFGTSITIGADGLGLISYRGAAYNLMLAHCEGGPMTCDWSTQTSLDNHQVGPYPSIAIGVDGLGLISYTTDDLPPSLKVSHCSNLTCTSGQGSTLEWALDGSYDYTAITIGADGLGLISYYDATNQDLKVAHCSDVTCASAACSTLDSTGDVGLYASVTIGTDGLPLISYYDATNRDLKVVHCSNTLCSPWVRRR